MQVMTRGPSRSTGSTDNLSPFYNIPQRHVESTHLKVQGNNTVARICSANNEVLTAAKRSRLLLPKPGPKVSGAPAWW